MIHIWLSNPHSPLRLWQETSQTWQNAENWQEIATLVNLQNTKDKTACLYFPSMYLLHTDVELNTSQLKALGENGRRYLFEEMSIGNVDDLQVKIQNDNQLFALHQADAETWTQSASLAGLNIVALLPDFLLLNTAEMPTNTSKTDENLSKSAIYYQDQTVQLLRCQNGFGCAVIEIGLTCQQLSQSVNAFDKLYLTGAISYQSMQTLSLIENISRHRSNNLPKPVTTPTRHVLNFAVVKQTTKFPPYLKVIGMVAMFAIMMTMIIDGLRIYHYNQATKATKEQIQNQYNSWFPNERFNTKLNIERQLSGKLIANQSSQNTNVLSVLSSVQPVLQQYQITAKQLNFQNNRLELQLISRNHDSLNQLVQTLNAQGIQAKLGTVSPNETGAVATIDILLA